jgi:CBS-domain-containing membrane protein
MAKTQGKQSIIGAVGGILIGSAILLFVVTLVLNNLKDAMYPHTGTPTAAEDAIWNSTNASINQLKTFMTICAILLGILGIVLIGSTIIGAIGGGFGG